MFLVAVRTLKLEALNSTNKKIFRLLILMVKTLGLANNYLSDPRILSSQQDKRLGAHTQALQPRCQ
jgi:hypothetical protein